ncbi:MAG: 4-(cytidine 5'-diphospho)-2-C-methyl-D-erythritol kinase [Chloroflexota bacterium]|nr:4-(cytidine 5'-diphospho)-2-C-methyl-D-erythritol kinase [Chloroflexota bacterium]
MNLSLEVLGKRPDGYHRLRTIFQAIELHDELWLELASDLSLEVEGEAPPGDDNLVLRAARALAAHAGARGARIRLRKSIPSGAGLGGGSSDAAATLLGLQRLWRLEMPLQGLERLARELGADVSFFLHGGTACASGRGDLITPLPAAPAMWLVISVPEVRVSNKTARVFRTLGPDEYTDGQRVGQLAELLARGQPPAGASLFNGLFPAACRVFDGLAGHAEALQLRTGARWTLSGAGPAMFTVAGSGAEAEAVRLNASGVEGRVFVTCSEPPPQGP